MEKFDVPIKILSIPDSEFEETIDKIIEVLSELGITFYIGVAEPTDE